MFRFIKIILYRILPLHLYLLAMHYGFVVLYELRVLFFFSSYKHHYYIKKYIKSDDFVIDVGANLGHYTYIFSRKIGSRWKIFAIEPVPIFSRVLNFCFRRKKNIFVLPFALWSSSISSVTLGIHSNDSYIRTGLPKIISFSNVNEKGFQYLFSSSMIAGSDYFSAIEHLDYIKIDVEWYEMNILHDMIHLIKKHQPILQVEVNEDNLSDFFSFVNSIGYHFDNSAPKWDFIVLPSRYA